MTREEWLTSAKDLIIEKIFKPNELEFPPLVKISCGLCPGKSIGICVYPEQADDNCIHIFISPELGKDDVTTILATICHELVHAHCMGQGYECKHGAPFSKLIRVIGLDGPPKATFASEGSELHATLSSLAVELGPYPHAPLRKKEPKKRQSEMITYVSPTDPEYTVKLKFSQAYEKKPPRDYNDQPMVPADNDKFLELEQAYLGGVDPEQELPSE